MHQNQTIMKPQLSLVYDLINEMMNYKEPKIKNKILNGCPSISSPTSLLRSEKFKSWEEMLKEGLVGQDERMIDK